jgi:hypothetical protein
MLEIQTVVPTGTGSCVKEVSERKIGGKLGDFSGFQQNPEKS